jgi:transposase-like protein
VRGHGQKLTSKQEVLIAALLTEPTYAAAAAKAGVSAATLYRWLQLPSFRTAYRLPGGN